MSNFDDKCLFCGIATGAIPSFKVYETEHSLAFLDISPVSEGHTQVIPKCESMFVPSLEEETSNIGYVDHAKTLQDMPDEYLRDIGPVIKKVAKATGAEQYNILQNNGKLAFQHVDHVHFHVIPKNTATDGLVLTIDDNWPARQATKEDLAQTQEKMKGRL
ncbi:hit protein 1 [Steccherinum ochraceum]|uniref:Hit protein 1 n=1 Tax=Steccherinum ochraceum TaxID=92696 RepID=A0A4R0RY87_9APHY|nr:hit protein 1 [Steccherinum ochraceum]